MPSTRVRRVLRMATRSEPKQMDPNDVVTARRKDLLVGFAGMAEDMKYQVAKSPLAVTWTTFLMTARHVS